MAHPRRTLGSATRLGLACLLAALALVGCWNDSTTTSQIARELHTATLLSDGRVLIAGGWNMNVPTVAASAELYDPKTGTFSPTGSMATARADHTATLLSDGRVLVAGGRNLDGGRDWVDLDSAEVYDPATGTFSPTGSLPTPLNGHTATLLSAGRVLIDGDDASAELYDRATGTFSPTGSMATARQLLTATPLPDGRVLIAGGNAGNLIAPAELYDPKTGTFSPTGSMATAREYHTATLLPNGRVLIAGGSDGTVDLASAELYDPATGTFSPTGPLASASPR